MAKPIYDVLVDEMKALGLVEIPFLAERMSASIGAHVFNLNNLLQRGVTWRMKECQPF